MPYVFLSGSITGGTLLGGLGNSGLGGGSITGGVLSGELRYIPSFFQHAGKIIKYFNEKEGDLAAFDAEVLAIEQLLEAANLRRVSQGLPAAADAFKRAVYAIRDLEGSYVDARLTDIDSTVRELGLDTNAFGVVMGLFLERLKDDGITVKANVCTIGTPRFARGTGNSQLVIVPYLDGVTSPMGSTGTVYGGSSATFTGRLTELLAESETHVFRCSADSGTQKRTAGFEDWRWWSGLALGSQFQDKSQPDPNALLLNPIQSNTSLIKNLSFANGTTGWTAAGSGDIGSNVVADSTTGYRGDGSVYILGDGNGTIGLQYVLTAKAATAKRMYAMAVRYRVVGGPAASGTLEMKLTGTDVAAQTGDSNISVDLSDITDSDWHLATGWCLCQDNPPSDLAVVVQVSGNLTRNVQVYVDDLGFAPVQYQKGIGAFITAGDVPAVFGDRWECDTANDCGGVFQDYFRRRYGRQFWSVTDGTEVVDDALAT